MFLKSISFYLTLHISYLVLPMVNSYKYLGILHTGSKSHFIVGSALMKALAEKGHEVYVISPFPQEHKIHNYQDIPLTNVIKSMDERSKNLLDRRDKSKLRNMLEYFNLGLGFVKIVFEEPNVQQLMASNHTFDAVICEVFLSESLFGFSEYFKAPLIGIGTFGAISWNTDMVGSPSPPSYVPHALLEYTNRMSFTERLGNLAFITFEKMLLEFYYLPRQAAFYKKYFPNLSRDMYAVRRNAALVLLNTHVSLGFSRPYMPNQIEVGGMHINRQRKPLPKKIEQFISAAKHGVIYFSMGSTLRSKYMPATKRQEFLTAFKTIKQKVLWKFEDPLLEGKPENVYISDWFPQDDILAHEKVKIFITHGGLLSTTESIYHGKPVIGLPVYGDQFLNMASAASSGYGIQLDYKTLNANVLVEAINRILNNKSYSERVKEISAVYKDQPMLPADLAVYWVEHVTRHKGAKYMQCAGLELSFIKYHNIDVMLVLYGGSLLITYAVFCIFKFLLKRALTKFAKELSAKKMN